MEEDRPFDRRLRGLRRGRMRGGDGADFLFRQAADELVARLDLVARPFRTALDLGWGAPYLSGLLRTRGLDVVTSGEHALPSLPGPFDLAVSVGLLDTVNDLPGALALVRRALKPDGLFLAAFAGAGSLPRLRRAMRAAEEAQGTGAAPRIHPQIDIRAAGDLMTRAGFALPVVDRDVIEVRYSSLMRLIGDLRSMGATNQLAGQAAPPFGRIGLAAAIADFSDPGGTIERFEIIHVSGWAPAPDQPRPAARGSATASLADALKPKG